MRRHAQVARIGGVTAEVLNAGPAGGWTGLRVSNVAALAVGGP